MTTGYTLTKKLTGRTPRSIRCQLITQNRLRDTDAVIHDASLRNRTSLADAWSMFLESHGPYSVMLTIGFVGCHSDDSILKACNYIFFSLNRKTFHKSFETRGQWVRGFASLEQNRKGFNRGDLHCHALLKPFLGLTPDEIRPALLQQLVRIAPSVRSPFAKEMTTMSRVNVRIVDDQHQAAHYVTKEIGQPGFAAGGQVGDLGPRGIEMVALERYRPRLRG
jgi:hypothetical protein